MIAHLKKIRINQQAVTLIELLLGILVFSVISVVLYSSFSTGLLLNQRSKETNETFKQVRRSLDVMSRDIEQAVSFNFLTLGDDLRAFEGAKDRMSLITNSPSGLIHVEYRLVDEFFNEFTRAFVKAVSNQNIQKQFKFKDMYFVLRSTQSLEDFIQGNEFNDDQMKIIATHIQQLGLQLKYAGRTEDGEVDRNSLESEWEEDILPSLVRIQLLMSDSKERKGVLELTKDVYRYVQSDDISAEGE